MKYYLTIISLLLGSLAYGQPAGAAKDLTIGFEADALPYITGGYYGSVWAGHNHVRYRAIISRINIPGFIIKSGFENNRIDAYAALADYFFKPALKGWWIGGGVEYWKGEIQTNAKIQTARYDNGIFTLGTGYIWRFYKNFYLNPWWRVI